MDIGVQSDSSSDSSSSSSSNTSSEESDASDSDEGDEKDEKLFCPVNKRSNEDLDNLKNEVKNHISDSSAQSLKTHTSVHNDTNKKYFVHFLLMLSFFSFLSCESVKCSNLLAILFIF